MNCEDCENFQDDNIIKVVDEIGSPFCEEIYHFETGYKCTWNGVESCEISDLKLGGCRCEEK